MKKIAKMGAVLCAAFLGLSAASAENHHFGLDIQFGIPIVSTKQTEEIRYLGYKHDFVSKIFEGGLQLKLAGYECFAFDGLLGIYASAGWNTNFVAWGEDSAFDGDFYFGMSGEFMIGPAIGVDLGNVRFQTGLAFHAVFAKAWYSESYYDDYYDDYYGYYEESYDGQCYIKYKSCGFAVTPQFRFGASRRCSFVLGCDFTFDFPKHLIEGEKFDGEKDEDEWEFDKGFRFGFTPYLGIGINFGS